MTNEIAEKLLARDREVREKGYHDEKGTVVKYFAPWSAASWFIYSGTPLDSINGEAMNTIEGAQDWHLFGRCDLYGDGGELGYVLLSQLQDVRGARGLRIERDLHLSDTYRPPQDNA